MQRLDKRERDKNSSSTEDGTPHRSRKEDLVLNQYEQAIAAEVIAPEDIPVRFDGEQSTTFHTLKIVAE